MQNLCPLVKYIWSLLWLFQLVSYLILKFNKGKLVSGYKDDVSHV